MEVERSTATLESLIIIDSNHLNFRVTTSTKRRVNNLRTRETGSLRSHCRTGTETTASYYSWQREQLPRIPRLLRNRSAGANYNRARWATFLPRKNAEFRRSACFLAISISLGATNEPRSLVARRNLSRVLQGKGAALLTAERVTTLLSQRVTGSANARGSASSLQKKEAARETSTCSITRLPPIKRTSARRSAPVPSDEIPKLSRASEDVLNRFRRRREHLAVKVTKTCKKDAVQTCPGRKKKKKTRKI